MGADRPARGGAAAEHDLQPVLSGAAGGLPAEPCLPAPIGAGERVADVPDHARHQPGADLRRRCAACAGARARASGGEQGRRQAARRAKACRRPDGATGTGGVCPPGRGGSFDRRSAERCADRAAADRSAADRTVADRRTADRSAVDRRAVRSVSQHTSRGPVAAAGAPAADTPRTGRKRAAGRTARPMPEAQTVSLTAATSAEASLQPPADTLDAQIEPAIEPPAEDIAAASPPPPDSPAALDPPAVATPGPARRPVIRAANRAKRNISG